LGSGTPKGYFFFLVVVFFFAVVFLAVVFFFAVVFLAVVFFFAVAMASSLRELVYGKRLAASSQQKETLSQ
jgi:hypothetical protein